MQQIHEDELWLVFCVADNRCAVDSNYVDGVVIMPEDVTGVPDAEDYVRGIVKIRGKVVSILDMRTLFGNKTMEEELASFRENMEKGRRDHIVWMEELCACVSERRIFHKSTDAHQCGFGRWFDTFVCPIAPVRAKMESIREPHEQIHRIALTVNRLLTEEDTEQNRVRLRKVLEEAENLKNRILTAIQDAEQTFKDSFRVMLVLLRSENERSLALMVDEIVGVEKLQEVFHDDTLSKMNHSELVGDVAMDSAGANLLLLLDQEKIFALGQKLDHTMA